MFSDHGIEKYLKETKHIIKRKYNNIKLKTIKLH